MASFARDLADRMRRDETMANLKAAQEEIKALKETNRQLLEAQKAFGGDVVNSSGQNYAELLKSYREKNKRLRKELAEQKEAYKRADATADRFRTIITRGRLDSGLTDSTNIRDWHHIVYGVQNIVIGYYTNPASFPDTSRPSKGIQREIFEAIGTTTASSRSEREDLQMKMMGVILMLLDKYIFARRSFGLENLGDEGLIEHGMQRLEQEIMDRGLSGPRSMPFRDLGDWRLRTMMLFTEKIRTKPSSWPGIFANLMHKGFMPFSLHEPGHKDFEETSTTLLERWKKICENSFEFSLRLRGSGREYALFFPKKGTKVDEEHTDNFGTRPSTVVDVEPTKSGTVAIVFRPALVRYEDLEDGPPYSAERNFFTLLKANVVVYE